MKTISLVITMLVLMFLAWLIFDPFLNQSEEPNRLTGLPWQLEVLPDGSTKVFDLHLGHSRLADALKQLGSDIDVAIIAARGERGRLEMYSQAYRAGLLSGKMILTTHASEQNITKWRQNAVKSEYVTTGRAKKYTLSKIDLSQALQEVITGITFIPSANLDEATILARFGEPDQREQFEGEMYFIYANKGLKIVLSDEAKEVLQYIMPKSEP